MTSPSAVPPTAGQLAEFYGPLGSLLQLAWDDNFHFGYWEGPSDASSVEEATDRLTDLLAERLRVGPGDRVLDAGCGIGKPTLRVAASTGARVHGVNISEHHIEQATEAARAAGVAEQVTFQYADAMELPFAAGSFDALLALESIVHMDRPKALREWARVLAPGGRVVLTDVFPLEPGSGPQSLTGGGAAADAAGPEDDSSIASLTRFEDYAALVSGAGLELDELTDVTENTQGTFPRMLDAFLKHRREFERRHGVSVEDVLNSATVSQSQASAAGCLIMVAHKP
ncbi:SAM-dependent methyltransferase [Streptomyces boncukensis]|uniref:Methyltransferase domain-containing protein n=1 Tax=Streptomyces boncukensis TaxID=2711219 RepID=A0A6G4X6M7_9ACTN|nr:methyltransferase domain-containing protein [Streptomyces boncukensis]NGO72792.1 methyltransferase domain-containing protein [Streptomyces boncukensis]